MSICPHCSQRIDSQAIYCTYCHKPLKAYGHPGIPLYQASDAEFLCDRCLYHEDDTCTYPQRP
ncbi:MAG TPA: zinc ribbon domain-containing protein, partial [Cyanothece sp. UBA12306]|nr:zinc ribbon domain-containing protein [Cyanothece sp. UBA12306]